MGWLAGVRGNGDERRGETRRQQQRQRACKKEVRLE